MHVNTVHARCSFVIKTGGGQREEGDVAASNFRNLTNPGLPEISWDFARPSNWIRSGNEGRKRDRENEEGGIRQLDVTQIHFKEGASKDTTSAVHHLFL